MLTLILKLTTLFLLSTIYYVLTHLIVSATLKRGNKMWIDEVMKKHGIVGVADGERRPNVVNARFPWIRLKAVLGFGTFWKHLEKCKYTLHQNTELNILMFRIITDGGALHYNNLVTLKPQGWHLFYLGKCRKQNNPIDIHSHTTHSIQVH